MKMAKNRFYIDTAGNDDEAYREAMLYACQLAEQFPETTRIILLIGQKGSDGWFARLFDDKTVKKLYTGEKFNNCRLIFKFETLRTYKEQYDKQHDIVISCGIRADDLFAIDDFYCVHSIIAIPWVKEHTQDWIDTWTPTEIRNGQKPQNEIEDVSCIVQRALANLTGSINMSTGIMHPGDEELAKTYLLALYNNGEVINPAALRRHMVNELGWDTKHAQAVFDLAEILNSGKHFKGGSRDKENWTCHMKRWQEECAG